MAEITIGQTITTQQYANADNTGLSYYQNAYLFYVDVILNSQDSVSAKSNITIRHRMKCVRAYYSNYPSVYSEIAIGSTVMDTVYIPNTNYGQVYTLAEWTGDVAHDSSGELSLAINGIWHGYDDNQSYSAVSNTLANQVEFPPIYRISKIAVTPSTLTSGNATINVTKYVPAYTTTIKYKVEGTEYTLAEKSAATTFYLAYTTLKI